MDARSNFSPIPSENVPAITVTFSSVGCQCGEILYPAGILSRMVYGPTAPGSPDRTANVAPFLNTGGGSPHFRSTGLTMTCADAGAPEGGGVAAAGGGIC